MVVLIFVRHGKAELNELGILNDDVDGFPLVQEGIKKVKSTAKELKKIKVSRIIASPILRTRQTAEIIGKEVGVEYTVDDRLAERGYGKMMNKSTDDGRWLYEIDVNQENVETYEAMYKRILDFVDSLKDEKGIIVVVSHEPCIKAFLSRALGLNDFLLQGLKLETGNMSAVKILGKGKCEMITLNFPILNKETVSRINKAAS